KKAPAAKASAPAAKPAASRVTATLPAETRAALDTAIAELAEGARTWAALTVAQRVKLLRGVRTSTVAVAEGWARTAAASKGLDREHPLRGEEWMSGPYAVLGALDAYAETLGKLAQGRSPLDGVRVDQAPGGRLRVHA